MNDYKYAAYVAIITFSVYIIVTSLSRSIGYSYTAGRLDAEKDSIR